MEHKGQLFYKVNEKNIHGYGAHENINRDEETTVENNMIKIITTTIFLFFLSIILPLLKKASFFQ